MFAPVLDSFRNRWTWLAVNLVTAFIASRVIGLFEDEAQEVGFGHGVWAPGWTSIGHRNPGRGSATSAVGVTPAPSPPAAPRR